VQYKAIIFRLTSPRNNWRDFQPEVPLKTEQGLRANFRLEADFSKEIFKPSKRTASRTIARPKIFETFNVLRGGEYFFMPSSSALRWLGELG
jgi:hypothetical protein